LMKLLRVNICYKVSFKLHSTDESVKPKGQVADCDKHGSDRLE
jgi:hypothetical protein